MKSTIKPLATLFVAATFAFAGCEKEDNVTPITPDTPEEETPENIYVGTSWAAHLENDFTMQQQGMNIDMEITYDLYLDFLDSTHAELFQDLFVYFPTYPDASQSENYTEEFIYTFSEDTVVLHGTYVDEETGDTIAYTFELPYDKEAKTLTIDFEDPDMAEIMGTSVVVLNLVENSDKTIVPRPQSNTGKTNWQKVMSKIAHTIGQ